MTTPSTIPDHGSADAAEQWTKAAAAVLRKARRLDVADDDGLAWSTLAGRSLEGVLIPPLGTPDRTPEPAPGVRGRPRTSAGWDVRTLLTGNEATAVAADALGDLENGATSLWLCVGGAGVAPHDIPAALSGVYLEAAPVVLNVRGAVDELDAATQLAQHLADLAVPPAAGTSFGADPISRAARRRGPVDLVSQQVAALGQLASRSKVRALVVDGSAAHDLGAGEVAELGYTIAVGATYLRMLTDAGFDLTECLEVIDFRYAATVDQFLTIAKFRAARALWHRVVTLCGADADRYGQRQHAVTSVPMMTRYDPWVNLLRTTVAAFAAGVGGADAVTVIPFDALLGRSNEFGRRLARNTSTVLTSESRAGLVDDPAGGAFAVEMLTDELAEQGWAAFQRIEAAGGILAAITDGTLYATFDAAAAERRRRVADRELPIIGVTEYPNLGEEAPERDALLNKESLEPERWAAPFEALRDQPPPDPVVLATLGSVAEHNPRATFATHAFAAGGIAVGLIGVTGSIDDVLAGFARSRGSVVCLAGTDARYREWGAELIAGLRAAGATRVIVAGRASAELAPLVDDQLVQGADLLAFLLRTRESLMQHEKAEV